MTTVRAVVFDMYETLVVNTSSLWIATFQEICRSQDLPLSGQELWDLWKPIEMQFRKDRLQPDAEGNQPPFKSYRQAWKETFESVFLQLGRGDADAAAGRSVLDQGLRQLFPESRQVITTLRNTGRFKLGLFSNADDDALFPLLEKHRLCFDSTVTSEGAKAYKPLPRPFLLVLEALDLPAEACLYVGDSQLDDVYGAKNAGMQSAWLNRRGGSLDPGLPSPDYEVNDLSGLLKILNL